MRKTNLSLIFCALLLAPPGLALAASLTVAGIMSGRVMMQVDGSSRIYSVGQTINGIYRVVEVGNDHVVLESQGRKQRVNIGQHPAGSASGEETAFLRADSRGHYKGNGTINDRPVRFMVDTGATHIAMGLNEARRLGLDKQEGSRGGAATANGVMAVTCVLLDKVSLGEINLTGVQACYSDKDMPEVLLGMSFLGRTEIKIEGSQLQLKKR